MTFFSPFVDTKFEIAAMCEAPFGFGTLDTASPNELYRPWLERDVGKQGEDWEWRLCTTPGAHDIVQIAFKDERAAILFTLKYGPAYTPFNTYPRR